MYLAKEPCFEEDADDNMCRLDTYGRVVLFREEAAARKYAREDARTVLRQTLVAGNLSNYVGEDLETEETIELCTLLSGDPDNEWSVYSLDPIKTEFSDETLDRVLDILKVFDWDIEPIEPQD